MGEVSITGIGGCIISAACTWPQWASPLPDEPEDALWEPISVSRFRRQDGRHPRGRQHASVCWIGRDLDHSKDRVGRPRSTARDPGPNRSTSHDQPQNALKSARRVAPGGPHTPSNIRRTLNGDGRGRLWSALTKRSLLYEAPPHTPIPEPPPPPDLCLHLDRGPGRRHGCQGRLAQAPAQKICDPSLAFWRLQPRPASLKAAERWRGPVRRLQKAEIGPPMGTEAALVDK